MDNVRCNQVLCYLKSRRNVRSGEIAAQIPRRHKKGVAFTMSMVIDKIIDSLFLLVIFVKSYI